MPAPADVAGHVHRHGKADRLGLTAISWCRLGTVPISLKSKTNNIA